MTNTDLRWSIGLFSIGLICFGLALYARLNTKASPAPPSPSPADAAITFERQQAIDSALNAGRHDYAFTISHAPPPISP